MIHSSTFTKKNTQGKYKTNYHSVPLKKKNDRQCELRCRELSLQEKKFELDEYERKKKGWN